MPDLIFVIDTNKEAIAIAEARRLNIPVAAIVDTNCDPDGITLPIPGNDDAGRAVALYCDLVARAALDGISRGQGDTGVDVGASEEVPDEPTLAEASRAGEPPTRRGGRAAEAGRRRRPDFDPTDIRDHRKDEPDGHHSADGEGTA